MSRCLMLMIALAGSHLWSAEPLPRIRVSDDGTHFVSSDSGARFVVWGVNYDHDRDGRLLDEYWEADWATVVEDFQEIKRLGANCVRVHLQFGLFMEAPDAPNAAALRQLGKLVRLAEDTGLYLDVTGLACYHKKNVPDWYDALDEDARWDAQANFWRAVVKACQQSPAIFCYDLMNEPILPGKEPASEWLGGELAGKFFVQRLALDASGRDRKEIAAAWVRRMSDAIRSEDSEAMVTVGVIPWVFVFGKGKPLFHASPVGDPLDFVSVHFYPERGKVDAAIRALQAYEVGKPVVVEEMFPLKAGIEGMETFVRRSASHVDGWVSFYWGKTADELRAAAQPSIAEAITAQWLDTFQALAPAAKSGEWEFAKLQSEPVRVVADVPYRAYPETDYEKERCKLDWYLPSNSKDFPTLVWFHGGGLRNGDKAGEKEVARAKRFAAEGVAVVNVNYRLSPQATYPSYVEDAAASVAFVLKQVAKHGGATDRVFVAGHSAGGYLTAMVGSAPKYLERYEADRREVAGYLPISGQMVTHSTVRAERGISRTRPVIDEAAPAYHVTADTAPFLCVAGSEDLPARAEETLYFTAAMKAAGHRSIEHVIVDGRDHGSIAEQMHLPDDIVARHFLNFIEEHRADSE